MAEDKIITNYLYEHMDKEQIDYLEKYLQKKYFKTFKTCTLEDSAFYESLNIERDVSYYILCKDKDFLNKFSCMYLMDKYVRYSSYFAYTYAEAKGGSEREIPEDEKPIESEVVILNCHKYALVTDKAEEWFAKTILRSTEMRNNHDPVFATIFLTQRDIPLLKGSGEFTVLDLNKKAEGVKGITMKETEDDGQG